MMMNNNAPQLQWLSVEYVKQHSRICRDCEEDALLEQYCLSAEETILDTLNRTLEDIVAEKGYIPARLYTTGQMLVDVWYQHRSPVESVSLAPVPYTFEIQLKPLMKLAD